VTAGPLASVFQTMIVGEEIPRIAVVAVILAYGSPLSFTQVRTPLLPRHLGLVAFLEARALCVCLGGGRL